jgi:hypothetical protein
MEITKTVIEEYRLEEDVLNSIAIRCATIQFKDGDFYQCDYKLNKNPYSCADWLFIEKVANKIMEIQENKNEIPVDTNKIKEYEKVMENCRKEIVAGHAQIYKKMTFDDVIWPPTLKCYPGMGIAVDKITPESLQKALNELEERFKREILKKED